MRALFRHIIALLFVVSCSSQLFADIGETYDLKIKRAELLEEVSLLRAAKTDSVSYILYDRAAIEELTQEIIILDEQIFASYDESLSRLSAQRSTRYANEQLLTGLAITTTLVAIMLGILMLMARSRVMKDGNSGFLDFFQALTSDLLQKTSPEKSQGSALLRVNLVVMVGLLLMAVSIVAFLIQSF